MPALLGGLEPRYSLRKRYLSSLGVGLAAGFQESALR